MQVTCVEPVAQSALHAAAAQRGARPQQAAGTLPHRKLARGFSHRSHCVLRAPQDTPHRTQRDPQRIRRVGSAGLVH